MTPYCVLDPIFHIYHIIPTYLLNRSIILLNKFSHLGQTFDSVGKVLVQSSCYEKFCDRLKDKVAKLRVGDALDHSIDIGATIPHNLTAIKETISRNSNLTMFTVRILKSATILWCFISEFEV